MPVVKSCLLKRENIIGCSWLGRRLLSFLAVCWVLCQLVKEVEMRPMLPARNFTQAARWVNPCDLPGHLFDPKLDMIGAPEVDKTEICTGVRTRAKIAQKQASKLLNTFVDHSFRDSSVVEGTASHRLSWLPKINREDIRGKSIYFKVRLFYNVLQYYGVALEQVILDMTMYDSTLLPMCQEAENLLTQTLCQLHLATFMLRIRLNPDVTRDVMQQEYRSGTHSQRTLRNYMIFRDYEEVLSLMVEVFDETPEAAQRTFPTTPLYNMLFKN